MFQNRAPAAEASATSQRCSSSFSLCHARRAASATGVSNSSGAPPLALQPRTADTASSSYSRSRRLSLLQYFDLCCGVLVVALTRTTFSILIATSREIPALFGDVVILMLVARCS